MVRLSFETEGEPQALLPLLEVIGDSHRSINAVELALPGTIQTREYAEAILGKWEPEDLARQRAGNRLGRGMAQVEAGVRLDVFTSSRALGNLAVVGGNKEALYGQLAHLAGLVRADRRAGEASKLRVGIANDGIGLRQFLGEPLVSQNTPRDVTLCETSGQRTFVIGGDGYEVDDYGTEGARRSLVVLRRSILDEWTQAVRTGHEAEEMIHETMDLLEAA